MLDIKFIRENPDAVKENIKKKFQEQKLPLVDQVLELDVLDGLVCSTTSVGGVLALDSLGISLNDGQSELLLVRDIKNLIDFNNVSTALLKSDFRENENIVSKKVRRVKFLFDSPVDWTLDGEYGGTVKEVEIVNHQRAINIIVPR